LYIIVIEDERGALISEYNLYEGQLSLGRTPDNDVILQSGTISRYHAELFLDGPQAYIVDKQSANGVIVNEQRIKSATLVDESTHIRIGEYRVFLERATGKMKVPERGISTAILRPDDAHAKLLVLSGPKQGLECLLFDPITCIGRTDENDITLPDVSISRQHARVKRQDDGSYVITDLGSSNGTLVKGKSCNQSARVRLGEPIQFGNVECVLLDPSGQRRGPRLPKQWMIFGGAIFVAAVLGALLSLLFKS